jgi:hypothetical protein
LPGHRWGSLRWPSGAQVSRGMTPSEHIVNVALRMKLRVEGERQAVERETAALRKCKAAYDDAKERLEEAQAEYTAMVNLMRNSDDPDLLMAYMAKL